MVWLTVDPGTAIVHEPIRATKARATGRTSADDVRLGSMRLASDWVSRSTRASSVRRASSNAHCASEAAAVCGHIVE